MEKTSLNKKFLKLVGGKEVMAFSLTIFGTSMVSSLMGSALSFFYTEVLHIAVGVVGTIFLVARIWEAVNDPFMGFIVDRTHTKWGKCIPYLRIAPIPLFVASVFMFLPIQNASASFKSIYAGIFYIIYYMLFTAVDVPISGLSPLLFLEQGERNKAVSISSTIGSTGSILPSGLYFALVLLIGGSEKSPMGNFISATLIIGIGCLCIMASSRFLKEKIVIPYKKESILKTILPIFKNKPMLIVLLVSLFGAPMGMMGNALVYFTTWNYADTGLSTAFLFPALQITSGLSWMLSVLCVPFLLKLASKKKMFIIMAVAGAVFNVVLYLIGFENVWLYMIFRFFANFPSGVTATITALLLADSIEYAEWKTGVRTEGVTYAVVKFVGKISGALTSALTMFILSMVNYDSKAMQATKDAGISISQTYPEVLHMLFILMTLTMTVAFILQLLPMLFYKFEGAFQKKVLDELKERRLAKDSEVQLIEEERIREESLLEENLAES
ncbi:MAG: glycoside-pentoside-hexuronide (GPH):cation symporter [Eubacteriales bacterium]